MSHWVLGVDVGGTGTRVLLSAGPEGPETTSVAAGGNPHRVGIEGAVRHLRQALGAAFAQHPEVRPAAACIGMAGLSHPARRDVLRAAFRGLPEAPIRILTDDGSIAWAAAFGEADQGILVMAGTGSGVLVRDPAGELVRLGGLGPLLGDEGSGHQLGLAALRAAARAAEGRAPAGPLLDEILRAAGVTDLRQLSLRAVAGTLEPSEFFAPLLRAAERGDDLARTILEEGGRELADLVGRAAVRQVPEAPWEVATSGSVPGRSPLVREALFGALREAAPGQVVDAGHQDEPVRGAVFLARRALEEGRAVTPGW